MNGAALALAAAAIVWSFAPLHAGELKGWGRPSPAFVLPSASGHDVRLTAGGARAVVVHFFATWCEPCRDELPALNRLAERASPHSLAVIAISVAEPDLRVRRFLDTMPLGFPVLLDRDRAVAKAWTISTLPSTVILDADLKPCLAVEADLDWDRIDPATLIEQLKAAPAKPATQASKEERS